ncbi:MAG TPA: T9SS type A sorting domain-containing protein [Saprospiraceae bacterium]|nr:T9SS type A sorting domain-containing protein [Saprospiraceae bacterium]
MTVNEKGRYCNKCAKTVVDFSQVSDELLAQLFIQKKGKICGRFNTSQLNRDIQIPMPAKPSRNVATVGLLLTSLLGATTATSQTTSPDQIEVKHTMGEIALPQTIEKEPSEKKIVEGIVTDAETNEVLIGVNVYLKDYDIGVVTDFEGRYKLEIPDRLKNKTLTMVVSYIGFETKEIKLHPSPIQNISIAMTEDITTMYLGEVSCLIYPEEETLWKKLKNLVHNLKEKRAVKKLEKASRKHQKETNIVAEELRPIKSVDFSTIEIHHSIEAKVYPNPFSDNLNLALHSEKEQVVLLRIFSISGKEVFAKKEALLTGDNEIHLNLNTSTLAKGNYLLQLIDVDGLIQQFRIVKIDRL